jgi:uncharacterized protein YcfJ
LTTSTTIELPRLENESARAYAARVEYVTMGAGRSIDKLADQQGRKKGSSGSRSTTLLEWSRKYGWVDSARQYDEQIAYLTVQDAAQQYQESLRAFRVKYGKTGEDLHKVASVMLSVFAQQLQGKTITDKDGKKHVIAAMEMNAGTLGQIKAALQTAADLEALALRVEGLLSEGGREEAR